MASGFQLLYSALDGSGTVQLWTSDGTVAGTVELSHVANDWGGLYAEGMTGYDPASGIAGAAFRGIDAAGNPSLWTTDGTQAGTRELAAAGAAAGGIDPKALIALGRQILFSGTDDGGRTAIWATDGTDGGTVELGAVDGVGPGVADPQSVVSDGRAFFSLGGQLVVSDGTAGGTVQLAGGVSADAGLAAIPGGVMFGAGGQLWVSDGTAGGTRAVTGIRSAHAALGPQDIVGFGGGVLFRGVDAAGNAQLWFSDGSEAGTRALTGFADGAARAGPLDITALDGRAVFFAADAQGVMQLWGTDGTADGTAVLTAVADPGGLGLVPGGMAVAGDTVVFSSPLGGLWRSDGTQAGTFGLGGTGFYAGAAVNGGALVVASGGAAGGLIEIDVATGGSHVLMAAPYATGLMALPGGLAAVAEAAPPCFLPGTRVLTWRGEVAVEALALGDLLMTAGGGWQELRWVGRGRAEIGAAEDHPARPVLIRAGALGEGVPRRDLRVTQGHCLLFPDGEGPGALVPAVLLVNGRSILLEPGGGTVEYYHVGVTGHDVVLAEGAACETWHHDGAEPPFDSAPPGDVGAGPSYAPKLGYGARTVGIWRALRARAGCGEGAGEGADPELYLLADGRRVWAEFSRDGVYRFTLERRPRDLRLVSRTAVPATGGLGPDIRRLGVGVREIAVAQGGRVRRFGHADAALAEGFHPAAPGEGLRWTAGEARLDGRHLRLGRGRVRVQIEAVALAAYPQGAA